MSKEPIGEIVSKYDLAFLNCKADKQITISEETEERIRNIGQVIKDLTRENITTFDGLVNYLIDHYLEYC